MTTRRGARKRNATTAGLAAAAAAAAISPSTRSGRSAAALATSAVESRPNKVSVNVSADVDVDIELQQRLAPWEAVEIKLEPSENSFDDAEHVTTVRGADDDDEEVAAAARAAVAAAEVLDVKPDVDELQLEIARQQQLNTTAALSSTKQQQRLLIIGDLCGLNGAQWLTGANGVAATIACANNGYAKSDGSGASSGNSAAGKGQKIVGRGIRVGIGRGSRYKNFVPNPRPATLAVPAAPVVVAAAPTNSKFLDDPFVMDEMDMQQSDIDEDGYSDIDFDEDDEMVEDDDEIDLYDPIWTEHPNMSRLLFKFERTQSEIGLEGRPKTTAGIYYFDKMLGDRSTFFDLLAESANARAQQLLHANIVGQTYLKPITSNEMETFFGLCLQMSTLKLPTIADYWNEKAHPGFSGFGSKMSLNRFQMLLRVLNFDRLGAHAFPLGAGAVNGQSECDGSAAAKLGDLVPLVNFFNQRMEDIYKCGQRLVINEPLMFWKGKFNWVRDLSEKFRCNALTLHFLTEQTGLLLKIVPDVERKERKGHVRNSKLLVGQRVQLVKELLSEKIGCGHTVYVSKYYGSYGLGYELSCYDTYCTGLLDSKRYGNSKQLIAHNLEPNQFATKYASALMMCKWRRHDKCVYFYSTDCLAIYAYETSTRNVDARPKLIKELDWQLKPPANIREHMLNYHLAVERTELKWDKQVAIYIFNLMVLNAYILYTMYAQFGRARIIELHLKDTSQLRTYAEFRQDVIAALVPFDIESQTGSDEDAVAAAAAAAADQNPSQKGDLTNATNSNDEECGDKDLDAPALAERKRLLEIEHLPMVIPRRKGKVMKKKCRICRKGGMLTFTKLCCEACPGMPGLCEEPCFQVWHKQLRKSLEAGEKIKTRTFGTSDEMTIYF